MKVLLVECLGHVGGHYSAHTNHLSQALTDVGVDITLLTFNGLVSEPAESPGKVKHISFTSRSGAIAPAWRFLSCHLPKVLNCIVSTICTFRLALREAQREKNAIIHILDAYPHDFAPLWFASLVGHRNLIFTLFYPYRETDLEKLQARFKQALSERELRICLQLSLTRLLGARPATALKHSLYRRAGKRNRLAFISYTKSVHDSYFNSPFYDKIIPMFRGIVIAEQGSLTAFEARRTLGLPRDGAVFLHFGGNHSEKDFEVIFRAAKDLSQPYKLLFAGKVDSVGQTNSPSKLVKKYGLGQDVVIVNKYIPEEEMPHYFCAADAVILSYRKHFKRVSGVLSTAAQFNLPVIASDVREIGEAVRNYKLGLTFEAESAQSLREAILSFLSLKDDEKRGMRKNLSRFVQDHSWHEVAQRHLELYQSLLDGK